MCEGEGEGKGWLSIACTCSWSAFSRALASAAPPSWAPLADPLASLSLTALELPSS